jgi:hypothetical protein
LRLAAHVFTVLKKQVFGALEDVLVLLGGLLVLAVSHFVDHTAESGHDVKQVEDDPRIGQFF